MTSNPLPPQERRAGTVGFGVGTRVTILGEGSFHQLHGGTTTNLSGSAPRHDTLSSYSDHFKELRGRDFMGHRKRLHYVGSMFDEAARTRFRAFARRTLDEN